MMDKVEAKRLFRLAIAEFKRQGAKTDFVDSIAAGFLAVQWYGDAPGHGLLSVTIWTKPLSVEVAAHEPRGHGDIVYSRRVRSQAEIKQAVRIAIREAKAALRE